jgi:tetratricopeptide (TPR) repeat protein
MHRGNGAVALAMAERAIVEIEENGANANEAIVLRAAALVQLGRTDDALVAIESVQDSGADHPFTRAVAALVHMTAGLPNDAIEHADAVAHIEGSTYLDQVFGHVAAAGAAAQLGDFTQAEQAAESAVARAVEVGDVVATALATATFHAVTGRTHSLHDERTQLGDGWDNVVQQLTRRLA